MRSSTASGSSSGGPTHHRSSSGSSSSSSTSSSSFGSSGSKTAFFPAPQKAADDDSEDDLIVQHNTRTRTLRRSVVREQERKRLNSETSTLPRYESNTIIISPAAPGDAAAYAGSRSTLSSNFSSASSSASFRSSSNSSNNNNHHNNNGTIGSSTVSGGGGVGGASSVLGRESYPYPSGELFVSFTDRSPVNGESDSYGHMDDDERPLVVDGDESEAREGDPNDEGYPELTDAHSRASEESIEHYTPPNGERQGDSFAGDDDGGDEEESARRSIERGEEERQWKTIGAAGVRRKKKSTPIRDCCMFLWAFRWQFFIFFMTILALVLVGMLKPSTLLEPVSSTEKFPPQAAAINSSTDGIACDVLQCSQLASVVMNQLGGTAADAMVAATLCLNVMAPHVSSLGGGGFVLLRYEQYHTVDSVDVTNLAIDCRETAPWAANSGVYKQPQQRLVGPLSIATPGQLMCLWELHRRFGVLSWSTVVQPAAALALNFTVTEALANALNSSASVIVANPPFAAVFAPQGRVLTKGQTCSWPALSNTLHLIATQGPSVLYNGTVGLQMVSELPGSLLSTEDLLRYEAITQAPLSTYYGGMEVFSTPAPSSGPVVLMALNLLEEFNLALQGEEVLSQHELIESLKFAFENRAGLGDPRYDPSVALLVEKMLSKSHAAFIRNKILPYTTFTAPYYVDLVPLEEPLNSPVAGSHISIMQKGIGLLSVGFSTSIGSTFGSFMMSPSTGIILNANMREFSDESDNTTRFDTYPPSYANRVEPGKRPMSSLAPMFLTRNNIFMMGLGSSGNTSIPYSVLQVLLNYLNFGMDLSMAVTYPRVYCPFIPEEVHLESGITSYRRKELEEMHYSLIILRKGDYLGSCNAVAFSDSPPLVFAAADRRCPSAGVSAKISPLRK